MTRRKRVFPWWSFLGAPYAHDHIHPVHRHSGWRAGNTGHHHHFFVEPDGALHDFPSDKVTIAGLPAPPKGTRLSRVDVIVRVRR